MRRLVLKGVIMTAIAALAWGFAQPANYTDPPGYPGAWPADFAPGCGTCWRPYTFFGANASDPAGSADRSTGGTTPQSNVDIVNDNNGIAFYYYGDGTNLYFRFVLNGPPGSYTGQGQPFTSANWSILMDINGDGYRDFAVMLFGADSGVNPDDILVMYNTTKSQAVSVAVDSIWRQDSARHADPAQNNTVDGLPGSTSNWNISTDPYVYNFQRTRVVQIDRNLPVNSQNARYYLDLQIPTSALDARSRGGPRLLPQSAISLAVTTANSNTNPAQKDFLFPGDYVFNNVNQPLPYGDGITVSGQPPIQRPFVSAVTAGTCSSAAPLAAAVSDTIEAWGSNQLRTTVRSVQFHYLQDLNRDGQPSPGETWQPIGTVTMNATATSTTITGGTVDENISPWRTTWNPTALPQGQYLIRAVATDREGNVSDSAATSGGTANPEGYRVAVFDNTCGAAPQADVAITKTASPEPVLPGQNITYTLTVTNNGPAAASNVTVTDNLPAQVSFVSCTATGGGSCGGSGNNRTIAFASLASGATATITLVAQVNTSVSPGATFTNTATVSSTTGDPNTANNTASVTSTAATPARADLAISKTAAPQPVLAGQNLTYTLTVTNNGPDVASSVTVTDNLPQQVMFVSCNVTGGTDGACGGTGNNRTITFTSLASGATATITLVAQVNAGVAPATTITNTATVSSTTADPNTANNTATATSTVAAPEQADLAITKTASPEPILAGQNLTYTLTVTNAGPSGASNIVVTDNLPAQVTFVSCNVTGGTGGACAGSGNNRTITFTSLASGATATVTIVAQVNANVTPGTTITNTATVSSATADPNTENNTATVTTTVGTPAPTDIVINGTVFYDDGLGGGTANNAIQEGGEQGVANVTVTITDGTNTLTATTDAAGNYAFTIPATWGATLTLSHPLQPATGHNVQGGNVYQATAFGDGNASSRTVTGLSTTAPNEGYNFGVVRPSQFSPDQEGQAPSPGTITYTHLYRPGTLGTVTMTAAGLYEYSFFLDANCDGEVGAGERTSPVTQFTVGAGWPREADGSLRACAIAVDVSVPPGQTVNAVDVAIIEASLTWTNNGAVQDPAQVVDTTAVADAGDLQLAKAVRNLTQEIDFGIAIDGASGDVLEYRIIYLNTSETASVSQVRLSDPVPTYTQVVQNAYGDNQDIELRCPDGTPRYINAPEDLRLIEVNVMDLCGIAVLGPRGEGMLLYRARID